MKKNQSNTGKGISDRVEVAMRELTRCLQWYLSALRSMSGR